MTYNIPASIKCPCGCGEAVDVLFGDFNSTTIEVDACTTRRAAGMALLTYRKSAGLSFERA